MTTEQLKKLEQAVKELLIEDLSVGRKCAIEYDKEHDSDTVSVFDWVESQLKDEEKTFFDVYEEIVLYRTECRKKKQEHHMIAAGAIFKKWTNMIAESVAESD